MRAAVLLRALVPVLALAAAACHSRFEGGGDLRAQKVVLQREVEGMRAVVARLERGESMLPLDDVVISIDEALVRGLIAAQLPFETDVDRFHLSLKEAAVKFAGSPVVRLRGALRLKERPDLEGTVEVLGALEGIEVDPSSSILRAKIAVDHLGIEKAAGLEKVLSGATLDEVARRVRLEIKGRLPSIQIPVKVQQSIDLPAVTHGPVRIDGATMPLQVAVSAGPGRAGQALDLDTLPAGRPREDGRRAAGGRHESPGRRRQPRSGRRGGTGPEEPGKGEVTVRAPARRSRHDRRRPRPRRVALLRPEGPRHPRAAAIGDRRAREGARRPSAAGSTS